jgi:hypothetical protein
LSVIEEARECVLSGYVTISEIPQKLDYVADVGEEHKTTLMEYLRRAFVDGDSTVLKLHTSDYQNDNNNKAAKESAEKANEGKEKNKVSFAVTFNAALSRW